MIKGSFVLTGFATMQTARMRQIRTEIERELCTAFKGFTCYEGHGGFMKNYELITMEQATYTCVFRDLPDNVDLFLGIAVKACRQTQQESILVSIKDEYRFATRYHNGWEEVI